MENVQASQPARSIWLSKIKNIDRVILFIVIMVSATSVYSSAQAIDSIKFVGHSLVSQSIYFLTAFFIAAYMQAAKFENLLTRVFDTTTFFMILLAAAFGGLSPLCSCTVIPLCAVLLRSGVPLSAVMAFWISSPIISPNMYFYTAGILGAEFATAKLMSAIFMGIFSGFVIHFLTRYKILGNPLKGDETIKNLKMGKHLSPNWNIWKDAEAMKVFKKEFLEIAYFLTKWMVVAFFIESLMIAYIPAEKFSHLLGGEGFWSIVIAAVVGVPAYLHGVAAVPLIDGLITLGISKGAAMAFLIAGSVTSIPAAMAVYSIVKKRVFAIYVCLGYLSTIIVSYLYSLTI